MRLWLNGRIEQADHIAIDPFDRGLLLGDGIFDTMPAYHGAPYRIEDHFTRLQSDAVTLNIPLVFGLTGFKKAVQDILAANNLLTQTAAIRTTLTRGVGPRGLLPPADAIPTLMISAVAYTPPTGPAKLAWSDIRRNEGSPASRMKTLNYMDNFLARQEAEAQNADEALMKNNAGYLASASTANVFIVSRGEVFTPRVSDGALPGVTRLAVFELADLWGLPITEAQISAEAVENADEVFLTNSLIGIRPAAQIDGNLFPAAPPITEKLQNAYHHSLKIAA